ncbi:MAG TPA: 4Fe-4S binding protein [Anaerolineales bacterium]
MEDDVFDRLAGALDRLPNGFPRTPSNVEIKILKKIFTPEEAALVGQLTGAFENINAISTRAGASVYEITRPLLNLARRGVIWYDKRGGQVHFRLAPFIVGIYEEQVQEMDHELAHLVEDYFQDGGIGMMDFQPAFHRVVPARKSLKSEWILPYDDVHSIILAAKTFSVRDCICRLQQKALGRQCDFPVRYCLNFSQFERPAQPGDISQTEALDILDKSEEIGLVHTVSNVIEGVYYVCNCCGCCCGILRGITEFGIEKSVAFANYYAVIEPEFCAGCGTCIERCQVKAISDRDGVSVVDRTHCIGCGLCVTGCPNNVAHLERKPDAEIIHPPVDFAMWEVERLHNRGLIE